MRGDVFSSPEATKEFLTYKLANYERGVFAVLMLDNQHRLIEFKELFLITRE
nr:JAB domain-containing protein [Vibrio crassostreae]